MKQSAWSLLKKQLCPADKWIQDDKQLKCYKCSKEFIFLIRRKHHCRLCGKIFCSTCSDFYINGTYIDSSLEKYLRLCQTCYKKVSIYIHDMDKKHFFNKKIQLNEQIKVTEQQSQDSYFEQQQNLKPLFYEQIEQTSKQFSDRLNIQIKKKVQQVASYLCENNSIQELWIPILSNISLKAIIDTKMDTLFNDNLMDISHYVKIKSIHSTEPNITKYIKGLISSKNVSNKHMRTQFQRPNILIIEKSLDLNSFFQQQIKFEQIIQKQKQNLKKNIDKLLRYKPDIIFVQDSVNINALDYLQQNNVTVVSKIKQKTLEKIRKLVKIKKKVDKVWKIDKYKAEHIIGTCQKIYFKKYEYYNLQEQILMFIENQGMASVLIGSSDQQILPLLKVILTRTLKVARHLYLQKQLINTQLTKINKSKNLGKSYFQSFIDEKFENIQKFLLKKKLFYTKINLCYSKFYKHPDIQKQQIIQNYLKLTNYQNDWIYKQQSQLCNQPHNKQIKFYSKDDISLGTFIALKAVNLQKRCMKCNKPKSSHYSLYYSGNNLIRIIVQHKNLTKQTSTQLDYQNQDITQITKDKIHKHLRETCIQSFVIQTYIQCQICNSRLCDLVSLKRNYLQYSFLYFLLNLFTNNSQQKLINQIESRIHQQKIKICQHKKINRIFKFEEVSVKFMVQSIKKYRVDKLSLLEPSSLSFIKRQQQNFQQTLLKNDCETLDTLAKYLIQFLDNLVQISPRKSIFKAYNKQNLMQQIRKIKQNLIELTIRLQNFKDQSKSIISKNQDFTYVIRGTHQYYYILKKIRIVVFHIEQKLKKLIKKQQAVQSFEIQNQLDTTNIQSVSNLIVPLPDLFSSKKNESAVTISNIQKLLYKYVNLRWTFQDFRKINYVPIFVDDPISFIGYALNSKTFHSLLIQDQKQKQIKVKIYLKDSFPFQNQIKQNIQTLIQQLKIQIPKKDYKDNVYQVTIFNHMQFQKFRNSQGITFETFVKSIVGCSSWDNTGGKSGSRFAKSYNDIIVMKIINDKQFIEFRKFVTFYIDYVNQNINSMNQYLLTKIFGIFQVNIKGKIHNCIAMQNIFFQLDIKNHIVYDLKGSQASRFTQYVAGKSFTGLDTNFKIDRNGEPIPLKAQVYNQIMNNLQRDTQFLTQRAVIDYSLLLIINPQTRLIRMGIIDFMRPYHIKQKLETIYKEIKNNSTPTVIPPNSYSTRFMAAMKRYFIKIQE